MKTVRALSPLQLEVHPRFGDKLLLESTLNFFRKKYPNIYSRSRKSRSSRQDFLLHNASTLSANYLKLTLEKKLQQKNRRRFLFLGVTKQSGTKQKSVLILSLQHFFEKQADLVLLLLRLRRHAAGLANRHGPPAAVVGVHSVQGLFGADVGVELSQEARGDETRPSPPCPAVDEQDLYQIHHIVLPHRGVTCQSARNGGMGLK